MAPVKIRDLLTDNTMKTFYALDQAMVKAHFDDNNEYAESTARILLENPDLPLLIRIRSCLVLACSTEPDFLDMAKEAVRVAELAYSRCSDPGDFEKKLVPDAKATLAKSQARWDKMHEEEEEEGEIVWHRDWNVETDAGAPTATTDTAAQTADPVADQPETASKKKKKRVPRLITDPTKMTPPPTSPPRFERKQDRLTAMERGGNSEEDVGQQHEGKDEMSVDIDPASDITELAEKQGGEEGGEDVKEGDQSEP